MSKSPDEGRLSEALTHALRPLDRAALEDVAPRLIDELTDIRRDLEEIEAIRAKRSGAFGTRYRRYAQVATRRRAKALRQAQTDFDNASRDVNAAQTELDEARAQVIRYQSQQQSLEERSWRPTKPDCSCCESDPIMRDANRLSGARDQSRRIPRANG